MNNFPIDKEKYVTYNSRVQPVARDSDELSLTDLSGHPRCVVGTEVSQVRLSASGLESVV